MTPTTRRSSRHTLPKILSSRILLNRRSGNQLPEARCADNQINESQNDGIGKASAPPTWKRASDIVLVLLILPFVAFFALIVYCWIRIVSPGNVLFRQTRIGRGGKPFTIYKFRSMNLQALSQVHEAHVEHLIKSNLPMTKLDLVGDSRLIMGGCLIRTSGLDELPQLVNVLRGEMSLVGPRPCLPKEYELYDESQRHRFSIQPGLTGQWQVNRTNCTTFREMVKIDDDYVNRYSPWLDLQIMLKTPLVLLNQMKICVRSKFHVGHVRSSGLNTSRPTSAPMFALPMSATQKLSD